MSLAYKRTSYSPQYLLCKSGIE